MNWYCCGYSFYRWSPLYILKKKKWLIDLILLSSRQLWARWWFLDDRPPLISWVDWYKIGFYLIDYLQYFSGLLIRLLGCEYIYGDAIKFLYMWMSLDMPFTVLDLAYSNLIKPVCLLPADLFLDSSITACLMQKKWWDKYPRKYTVLIIL